MTKQQEKTAEQEKAVEQKKTVEPEMTVKQMSAAEQEKAVKQMSAAEREKAVKQMSAAEQENIFKQMSAAEREKAVRQATAHFEELLRAQLERVREAEGNKKKCDFGSLEKIVIGLCGGDGIGPIIMEEAERLLRLLLRDELQSGRVELREIRGLSVEKRLACGKTVPDEVLEEIKACHVLLKGPTTTPKGGKLESANVFLRRELDLFANIRPVTLRDENIDWIFFRENTEGEYALGAQGIEIPGALAMDFKVTTDFGTRRIARAAFDYARNNGKDSVAIITKANIMKKTDGNFSEICREVAKDYPGIRVEDWYVDITAANLIDKSIRSDFQVFVLPNLYGDIITDEAAQIQGGVGTAGSANIGDSYAVFEAIHGSAPRMIEAGEGCYANPSSIFKAAELLLSHIGFTKKAEILGDALFKCTESEKRLSVTGHKDGASCREFADYMLEKISADERFVIN